MKPTVVKIHSSGGSNGIHDYLMSDGSIETLSEREAEMRQSLISETNHKIAAIIKKNMKRVGLTERPEVKEQLAYIAQSLLHISESGDTTTANVLSRLKTLRSTLDLQISKVQEDYEIEGEILDEIIAEELKQPA